MLPLLVLPITIRVSLILSIQNQNLQLKHPHSMQQPLSPSHHRMSSYRVTSTNPSDLQSVMMPSMFSSQISGHVALL